MNFIGIIVEVTIVNLMLTEPSMDDIKVGPSCDDQQLKLLLLTEKMYDKESAMSNVAGGVET